MHYGHRQTPDCCNLLLVGTLHAGLKVIWEHEVADLLNSPLRCHMTCQMETEPRMELAPPPLQAVAGAVEGQAHSETAPWHKSNVT